MAEERSNGNQSSYLRSRKQLVMPKTNSPRSIELIESSIEKLIRDTNYQQRERVTLCKRGLTTSTWCDLTPAEEKEKRINTTTLLEHLKTITEQSGKETETLGCSQQSQVKKHTVHRLYPLSHDHSSPHQTTQDRQQSPNKGNGILSNQKLLQKQNSRIRKTEAFRLLWREEGSRKKRPGTKAGKLWSVS